MCVCARACACLFLKPHQTGQAVFDRLLYGWPVSPGPLVAFLIVISEVDEGRLCASDASVGRPAAGVTYAEMKIKSWHQRNQQQRAGHYDDS